MDSHLTTLHNIPNLDIDPTMHLELERQELYTRQIEVQHKPPPHQPRFSVQGKRSELRFNEDQSDQFFISALTSWSPGGWILLR